MDISLLELDLETSEAGIWVDKIPELGDIRIKTRGAGNSDYSALFSQLVRDLPREDKKDGIPSDISHKLTLTCIAQTCLLDIEKATRGGEVLTIEDVKAMILEPRFKLLASGCIFAANKVADLRVADREDAAKN